MSGLDTSSSLSPPVAILQRAKNTAPVEAPSALAPSGFGVAEQILLDALRKGTDRPFILDVEQQILEFLGNSRVPRLVYPKQNSYRRLLLHKLADYYGLSHVVAGRYRDEIVFYRRTTPQNEASEVLLPELLGTVVPSDHVVEECGEDGQIPSFTRILTNKKQGQSVGSGNTTLVDSCLLVGDSGSGEKLMLGTKTIEQRQAEYERARAEIFQDDIAQGISANSPAPAPC